MLKTKKNRILQKRKSVNKKISSKVKTKIAGFKKIVTKKKSEKMSLKKQLFFIPSLITSGNIICGLWAIFICIATFNTEMAILLIVLAGILDAFDGRTARFLGVAGKFGIELDSLADFISFGIAPMVIYFYSFNWSDKVIAYSILSIFSLCMALRLARFNMLALEPIKDKKITNFRKNFFFGLAAPVGAIALMIPLVTESIEIMSFKNTNYALTYAFIIALLLVIPIPIFSPKILHLGFKKSTDTAFTIFILIIIAYLLYKPLYCILTVSILYLLTIPVSIVFYIKGIIKLEKKYRKW